MSNQSKNKVKLNNEYRIIGKLPKSAINKIKNYFIFPDDALSIRINIDNALKHNKKHLKAIEKQLLDLGVTKEGYIDYIVGRYNQIRLGNKPQSIVLVVFTEGTSHLAALHLYFYKNENFWLVKSFHASRLSDLEKMELVWEK